MTNSSGNAAIDTSASCRSRSSNAIAMPPTSRIDVMRLMRPLPRRSAMASMSEVWREITRPDVYRSWNAMERRWKWRNRRRRVSSTTSWPTRPSRSRNALNDMAATTVIASTATTTVNRGRVLPLPPSSSGGMPLSMPCWISHGTANWHAVLSAMSAKATMRRGDGGGRGRRARLGCGSAAGSRARPRPPLPLRPSRPARHRRARRR